MLMRLIAWNTLRDYSETHPRTAASLEHLNRTIKIAAWKTPEDVTAAFSKAKNCGPGRVRFEVDGGNHRLIIAFNFETQVAFVKFIGTHAEYDKIDAATVEMF